MSTLAILLDDVAAELGEATRHELDGTIEFRREGRPFAASDAEGAEFRLRPDVAAAALRTPGVKPSQRGPEWVRFAPHQLDQFALDRATSWFEFAWHHALD